MLASIYSRERRLSMAKGKKRKDWVRSLKAIRRAGKYVIVVTLDSDTLEAAGMQEGDYVQLLPGKDHIILMRVDLPRERR
jgi:hypothetical protein